MRPDHFTKNATYTKIDEFIHKYLWKFPGVNTLDVGSMSISGSYRVYFDKPNWKYTGMDIEPGENVDIVSPEPYKWPFEDNTFDCIVSGQVLEHVEYPWEWMKEAYRVMKKNSFIFISVPYAFKEHNYPIDAWRFLPQGLNALFKWGGFVKLECCLIGQNFAGKKTQFTIGAAQKL